MSFSINSRYFAEIDCEYNNIGLKVQESFYPTGIENQFFSYGINYKYNLFKNSIINGELGLEGQYKNGINTYWGLVYYSYIVKNRVNLQPVIIVTKSFEDIECKMYGAVSIKLNDKIETICEYGPEYICRSDQSVLNLGLRLSKDELSAKAYISGNLDSGKLKSNLSFLLSISYEIPSLSAGRICIKKCNNS
jgi:hypothetical protein